jgi:hypothetical protein
VYQAGAYSSCSLHSWTKTSAEAFHPGGGQIRLSRGVLACTIVEHNSPKCHIVSGVPLQVSRFGAPICRLSLGAAGHCLPCLYGHAWQDLSHSMLIVALPIMDASKLCKTSLRSYALRDPFLGSLPSRNHITRLFRSRGVKKRELVVNLTIVLASLLPTCLVAAQARKRSRRAIELILSNPPAKLLESPGAVSFASCPYY